MLIRELAVMLLVLVLPWQALAAVAMPTAAHYHDATAVAVSVAAPHDADTRHAGHQHREHGGVTLAQDQESGSTEAAHGTCTNVCHSPALAADTASSLAIADHRGLLIPFATHPLPSRAPDSLERPPRSSLV